jgi:glycosyltransferase involved in cell wall biosynthesis
VEISSATLHARALPLAGSLRAYGIDCRVILPINWSSIAGPTFGEILSILSLHKLKDYLETIRKKPDVVIIGRSSSINLFIFLKFLKLRGIKVIFDLDDAVTLPSLSLLGAKIRSPAYVCAEKMLKDSDAVIVNGNYLYSYAKSWNSRVFVIHVPVDTDLFNPAKRKCSKKITIGWQGNPANHYGNLNLLLQPLEKLAKTHDFKFKICSSMGDEKVKQMFAKLGRLIEIDFGPDRWLPLGLFAEQMFDFDILVAPLLNSDWNQGKSALRVSAGMAMGIPVVASPFGEQKQIIHHGVNGFLATNEQDWYRYLKSLIENEDLRQEIGKRARETSEKELSLSHSSKSLSLIIRSL